MAATPSPSVRRSRRAEWALAAASTILFALAVIGTEAGLRAARPAFLRQGRVAHPHIYSETYGWTLRPGARYVGRGGETITIDERGYRGPGHADAPVPGVRRVVLLGDSITFGSGVSDAETFAHLLDVEPSLEVLNLGVDGYGTDQALLRLENEGLALRPDVVILNFCLRNDYFDNALPVALYDGRSPKPYFTVTAGGLERHDAHLRLTRRQRLAVKLRERSHLVNALIHLGGAGDDIVASGRDDEDWGERRQALMKDFDRAAEVTLRLIEEMARRTEAAGARFVVLVHPDRRAWDGDDILVTPLTSGRLGRTRIVLMEAHYGARKLAFQEITLDRLGHLSPRGHAVAAEIIRSVIDSLPGGPGRS